MSAIDRMRAALSDALEWTSQGTCTPQIHDALDGLAALEAEVVELRAKVARNSCEYCDGTGDVHSIDGEWRGECNCVLAQNTKLRAQLAEYEAAPTVAMLCPLTESAFNESTLMTAYQKAKMPHVELIARPAKD